ncbi:hypothetical protein ACHAPE_002397 [Trichoderma viride]
MSYVDNLSGQFGELGIGAGRPSSQPYQPHLGPDQQGGYGYHASSDDRPPLGPPPSQYHQGSPPPSSARPPLPEGWVTFFDRDAQRWSYKNEETGTAQWDLPLVKPPFNPPSHQPPLPEGWTHHFDIRYQRRFYANEAAGVVQWEAPGYDSFQAHPEPILSNASRGSGSSPYSPAAAYGQTSGSYIDAASPGLPHSTSYGGSPAPPAGYGAPSGPGQYSGYDGENHGREEKQKGSSGKSVFLGAAGGVAAGLVGGALLHHALEDDSSSDEERERPSYVPPPPVIVEEEYRNEYTYNDGLPTRDEEGRSVSESDRESVEEAREKYEEALHDVEDSSSASSSDYEELEEAREEYEEEYEETYED